MIYCQSFMDTDIIREIGVGERERGREKVGERKRERERERDRERRGKQSLGCQKKSVEFHLRLKPGRAQKAYWGQKF